MSRYDFELIWNNGKKSALVNYRRYANSKTEEWYCNWAGMELANIVSNITDNGKISRRIEVHVNAPNRWKADAYRSLSVFFDLTGYFVGDELTMNDIIVTFD